MPDKIMLFMSCSRVLKKLSRPIIFCLLLHESLVGSNLRRGCLDNVRDLFAGQFLNHTGFRAYDRTRQLCRASSMLNGTPTKNPL